MKKTLIILSIVLLSSVTSWGQVSLNSFLVTEDEEFDCTQDARNRSGTHDFSRCRGSIEGNIACYEDVREICVEKSSRRRLIRNYRQFTGRCASSYSQCR